MQSVLISGASRGLGRALAAECVGRGYTVYAGLRSRADAPAGCRPLVLNVRDQGSIDAAVAEVAAAGTPIDRLFNNAGIHIGGSLLDLANDDFKHMLDVNLLGAWRLTKAVVPHMRPGGVIAMISSLSGLVGLPGDGGYAASKFALEGMTQALATELAPLGIRACLFEPGAIATGFAGVEQGMSPAAVAQEMVDIVHQGPRRLRYPIGETGRRVADALDLDLGERAAAIVEHTTGTRWLSD